MPRSKHSVVGRQQLLQRLVKDCGLSYTEAAKIYSTFVAVIGDAVVAGSKISIGKVLSLTPSIRDPRTVNMNFLKTPGGEIRHVKRTYVLGRRLKYSVNLHREFLNSRHLSWFSQPQQ